MDKATSLTTAYYNKKAEELTIKFNEHFEKRVQPYAEVFIDNYQGCSVPKLLDLGSGPGRHGRFFATQVPIQVVCLDLSMAMTKQTHKVGLPTIQADMRRLPLSSHSFDLVWAYASLLHIPRVDIPLVLDEVARILSPAGLFGLAVKEGKGEAWDTDETNSTIMRRFTLFTDDEMRGILNSHFRIFFSRIEPPNPRTVWLNYLCRKK